jgi:lysophospholipase L1-like esterase
MRFRSLIAYAFCVAALSGNTSLSAEDKSVNVARWEADIAAFEADDKTNPPTEGGVVFYGSSSARLWNLKASFPNLQTVNRGFGGSDMVAASHFYERVVPPHRPRVVVLYEGDNDLASGRTACQILADFETLIDKHRQTLPESQLICLTVKYSPSRAKLRLDQEAANALLKARCARDPHLIFVDLASTLLDEQGQPQAKYFMPDMLHLNKDGYEKWNAKLLPVIEAAIKAP